MKLSKIIVCLIIVMMVPCMLFADMFGFTLGGLVSTDYTVDEMINMDYSNFDVDSTKLTYGAAADLKVSIAYADTKFTYVPNTKTVIGRASAGINLDVFFVRVKAGLGYQYAIDATTGEFTFGNSYGSVASFEEYQSAAFDAQLEVDVNLGKVAVGVYAVLPTDTTIAEGNWYRLFPSLTDNWGKAKVGLVVGYRFF